MLVLLALAAMLSMCLGEKFTPPAELLRLLFHGRGSQSTDFTILFQLRLPRLVSGIIVGMSLATAGAALQGLLRNPLAEPFVLGIAGGASIGVSAGILLQAVSHFGLYAIPVLACAGALSSMWLIYYLARSGAGFSVFNMILSGVIVNAVCSALIMFIMTVSSASELHGIVFWLMGRLDIADAGLNGMVGAAAIVACFAIFYHARDINLMALGEDDAHNLGVDVERVKRVLFISASVLTACAVSISGIVGFVGLLVPHFARSIVGADHRMVIPVSMISGALLLVLADTLARTIIAPSEIPVGVITALIGGPFFLIVLRRRKAAF